MDWTRRNVHLAGLGLVALIAVAISVSALWNLSEYDAASAEAEQARRTLEETATLLSDLKDVETGQRGYLLNNDERYLEPYNAALPRIKDDLAALTDLLGTSTERSTVSQLSGMVRSMLDTLAATIRDQRRGEKAPPAAELAGKRTMDAIRAICERLRRDEQAKASERAAVTGSLRKTVRLFIAGGTLVIVIALGLFGLMMHRLMHSRDALVREYANASGNAEKARDRLETTLQSIGDAVIVTDAEGRITLVNPVAALLTGWSRSEAEGEAIDKVFHIVNEATRTRAENPIFRVLRDGVVVGLANHTVLVSRSGQEVPIDDSGAPIRDQSGALVGVVLVFRDVAERYRSQRQLEESERRYRFMFENNPQPMWVYDVDTLAFLAVNHAAVQQYGYSHEEFLQLTLRNIRPDEDIPAMVADARESRGLHRDGPWRHRKKDGSIIFVDIIVHPIEFNGRSARVVLASDVTERRSLEEQLRQAQKLEAIGRLAGGIAHDFNNLLTVIIGYAELLRASAADTGHSRLALDEVIEAAERASSLTRQLLAFSRRQVLQSRPLDLNQSVTRIREMLSRLIGEDIEVVTDLSPDLWRVMADPGQIDQIVMNLAVNSRDAMDNGGTLTVQTRNVVLGEDSAAVHPDAAPGEYVRLSIIDTGCGMDAETQSRIFEPFFTTKEQGRGTGLGLAMVYGIVKQSGGNIWVYSEPGLGTSMNIYLPRLATEVTEPETAKPRVPVRGTETILLVEDATSLRELITQLLEAGGYKVLPAADSEEAMKICENQSIELDVLLTDIVLPGANGRELAAKAGAIRPGLKTLFMSGYSGVGDFGYQSFDASLNFIQKPFGGDALRAKLREVIDGSASEPG